MSDYDSKQTAFWSAVAGVSALVTAILKYKTERSDNKQKEDSKMADVKNIKDILIFGNEFSLLLIKKFKDGFQIQDGMDIAAALFQDGEIKNCFNEAIKDISKVVEEGKDIDAQEGIELGMCQMAYIPKYIAAIKK